MKVNIPLLTKDGRIRISWSPDGSGPDEEDACLFAGRPEHYQEAYLVSLEDWEEFKEAREVYAAARRKLSDASQAVPLDDQEIATLKESLIEQLYPDPSDDCECQSYMVDSIKRDLMYSELAPIIYGKEFVDEHRQKPPASDGPTLELDDETVERLRAISESDLPPDGDYI